MFQTLETFYPRSRRQVLRLACQTLIWLVRILQKSDGGLGFFEPIYQRNHRWVSFRLFILIRNLVIMIFKDTYSLYLPSRSTDNLIFGSKHNWKIAIVNGLKIILISSNKRCNCIADRKLINFRQIKLLFFFFSLLMIPSNKWNCCLVLSCS